MHLSGISDVTEAYQAAIKGVTAESPTVVPKKTSVQEKASAFSEHLQADQITAISKIQDGVQFLAHVVLSTSMNVAWTLMFYFVNSQGFNLKSDTTKLFWGKFLAHIDDSP